MKRLPPIRLGVRGGPREMPTVSSLVVVMSVEDLRSFKQVPSAIRLEMSNDAATLTVGAVDNNVYLPKSSLLLGFASPSLLW